MTTAIKKSLDVNKILDRLREYLGLKSDAEVAKFFGVRPNTVSMWRKRNKMDFEALLTRSDEIDLPYIIYGDATLEKSKPALLSALEEDEDYFRLTIYGSVHPGAGGGRLVYAVDEGDKDEYLHSRRIFHDLLGFWPPEDLRGVYIRGESMEPGLTDGQLVLYRPTRNLVSGHRYLLLIEDPLTGDWPLYVKRLQVMAGGGIKIISDNPGLGIEDELLVPNDEGELIHQRTMRRVQLRVVGRVLWPRDDDEEGQVRLITRTIERLTVLGLLPRKQ